MEDKPRKAGTNYGQRAMRVLLDLAEADDTTKDQKLAAVKMAVEHLNRRRPPQKRLPKNRPKLPGALT